MIKTKVQFISLLLITSLFSGFHNESLGQYVPSTINDFFLPGSQPLESGTFIDPSTCDNCHGNYAPDVEPYFNWQGSMMAQAQRDPLYLACLAIANQDAPEVGDLCIRCHTPKGWLEGRSEPTDGSALTVEDRQGITCHFCHKMIAPTPVGIDPYPDSSYYTTQPGNNPSTYSLDQDYLAGIDNIPPTNANGMYVADDIDNRRGPYFDPQANHAVPYSPFHPDAKLCGTCHDVSNPVYSAVKDESGNITGYAPNEFDTPAPDFNPYEMFPVERTYSEWQMSEYNTPGGVSGSYFGGNKSFVSTCQDCHMRDVTGEGCDKSYAPTRNDLPLHDMTGGNTFIPGLIEGTFPGEANLDALAAGILRARDMLQHAASMEITVNQLAAEVIVKVTNETGHKLPSGYPEGRRIWLNVTASNSISGETYESGHYDLATAELNTTGAKIYHVEPGLSPGIANALGLPAGKSFHFVLSDTIYYDNRIPPRGFTNANFTAIQSPPVGYSYTDWQYWDNTTYSLPFIPDDVQVTLYYQTTTKEYVEFLRDENYTNDAGQLMWDLWDQNGQSPPEIMNEASWSGPPVEPSSTFDLTVFLEGPFEGSEMNTSLNEQNALPLIQPFSGSPWFYAGDETVPGIPSSGIVDWLLLELRVTSGDASSATGSTMLAQQAVFLTSDGNIVAKDGNSLPELDVFTAENLFVVIWHRNHLGVMSSIPVVRTDGIYTYDFSSDENQVYGGALSHKELTPGIWGLIAADANADGLINADDRIGSWMVQAGLAGYLSADFNLDNQVNNPDKNSLWIENSGYSSGVPE